MKNAVILLLATSLVLCSCGGVKKSLKHQPAQKEETATPVQQPREVVVDTVSEEKEPIRVKEEKVIPVVPDTPVPSQYFVIIGSFRYPDNAARYQKQILEEGFSSVLLRNEQGLLRVSVLGTNDILEARAEIRRIRDRFPKHRDTWLLIQKK